MLTAFSSPLEDAARLLHVALAVGPPLSHHLLDLGVLARVKGGEGQVLELPADGLDAQAVGQRGVDLQGLLGLLDLLLLAQIAERAHVVQAVGQLDEDHPDVLGHGDDHLADVLRLLLLHVRKDICDSLVTPSTSSATSSPNCSRTASMDMPVSSTTSCSRAAAMVARVEPQVGADAGGADRVVDVGLAARPQLVSC